MTDQHVVNRYSIWMTDHSSWIITVWEAHLYPLLFVVNFIVIFGSHIVLLYSAGILFLCFFPFCFSISLISFYLCFSHTAPWCDIFHYHTHAPLYIFLSPKLLIFFLFLFTPHIPCTAHQGFCPGCWHCINWKTGTFVISPLSATEQEPSSKWAPFNNTDLP